MAETRLLESDTQIRMALGQMDQHVSERFEMGDKVLMRVSQKVLSPASPLGHSFREGEQTLLPLAGFPDHVVESYQPWCIASQGLDRGSSGLVSRVDNM